MARNLLRAGYPLVVYNRSPEPVAELVAVGATAERTPAAVGARVDVAITMLANTDAVEQVVLGAGGLAEGLAAGSVYVDMSSISPLMARCVAAHLAERTVEALDAPVSGGEVGARDATLAIMVGGSAATLERVRPILEALGKSIVHIGDAGAGQVAKACNQLIMVAAIQACAEAMHLARVEGVDLAAVRRALLGGSAASRVLEVMGERMVRRDFAPGIEARLHHKDFGLALEEARRLGCPLPVAGQVAQQLNALMGQGWGHDDTASLLRVLEMEGGQR
jgi:2-hydroxy-3-oxopropionate reductase